MSDTVNTSVKEEVIRMIQRLPDDCTLEDIQYHLFVRARIEHSLRTLDDGDGITQEELEAEAQEWLKSSGSAKPGAS